MRLKKKHFHVCVKEFVNAVDQERLLDETCEAMKLGGSKGTTEMRKEKEGEKNNEEAERCLQHGISGKIKIHSGQSVMFLGEAGRLETFTILPTWHINVAYHPFCNYFSKETKYLLSIFKNNKYLALQIV